MRQTEDHVIRWTVQPLIERPARALLALAAIAALSIAVAAFASEALWGLVAALVLGIALNRAFLPSRYALEPGALVVDHPLRRRTLEWSTLDRIAFDEHGMLVHAAGLRLSIDLPRVSSLATRATEFMRANVNEACAIVDRRTKVHPHDATDAARSSGDVRAQERDRVGP